MAEGDFATPSRVPYDPTSEKSIYRIPSFLRDLDRDAYEPRVISIGPYHHGKEKLKPMEDFKKSCLDSFLTATNCNLTDEFKREPDFLNKVRNCYTEQLESKWLDDDAFSSLMLVDGFFLLQLLLINLTENRALLSLWKMDMLVLDNQIPLLVVSKLASIIKDRYLNAERYGIAEINVPISQLIWKIYGIMIDGFMGNFIGDFIGDFLASHRYYRTDIQRYADLFGDNAHHVLDAYRKGCIWIRTGAYDGWASSLSVRELYYHGVKFRPSSSRSFRDVKFNVSDNTYIRLVDRFIRWLRHKNNQNNQNGQAQSSCNKLLTWITAAFCRLIRPIVVIFLFLTFWWWYILVGVTKGTFSLPRLTIDGTTRPTLLNLMDFERLHVDCTKNVTDYVSIMGSLIRSENDVEHLRKESILSCSAGWTNESVVKLFADLTRNVVFNPRKTNTEIDEFCERPPNKFWSVWRRLISPESSDVKSFVVALLTFYGLVITALSTCFTIVKYFKE